MLSAGLQLIHHCLWRLPTVRAARALLTLRARNSLKRLLPVFRERSEFCVTLKILQRYHLIRKRQRSTVLTLIYW